MKTISVTELEKLIQAKIQEDEQSDKLMEIFMKGDEEASKFIGITIKEWELICSSGNCPNGCEMDKSMKDQNCSIKYINSLKGGKKQTMALFKLREICKHYIRSENKFIF